MTLLLITDVSVEERIPLLEDKVQNLCGQIRSELEVKGITADDVLDKMTFLPIKLRKEYQDRVTKKIEEKSACSKSIRQLFRFLINPLTTFLDYKLLEYLISKFGSSQLKQDMADYVVNVNKFMRETTVADLMDHWDGIEDRNLNFRELQVRFGEDPTKCNLELLNKHRKKFCSRYQLSEFVMVLIFLKPGSYIAVWRIPSVLFGNALESAIRKDDLFMDKEGILSVAIAGKQIYPGIQCMLCNKRVCNINFLILHTCTCTCKLMYIHVHECVHN